MRNWFKSIWDFSREYGKGIPLDWLIWTQSGHAFLVAIVGTIASLTVRLLSFDPMWKHDSMLVLDAFLFVALVSGTWPIFSNIYAKHGISKVMLSLIAFILIGAGLGASIWALINRDLAAVNLVRSVSPPPTPTRPPANAARPITLKDFFENDWPDLPAYYTITVLGVSGNGQNREIKVAWRLNGDFGARSKFLAFFLEPSISSQDAVDVGAFIANNYQQFIDATDAAVDVAGKWPTDTATTHLKNMAFSKRIFIYYQNPDFSLVQKGSLELLYQQKALSILFRDAAYAWEHRNDHPPLRPQPLTPGAVLLPRALGTGLEISVTNLKPSAQASSQSLASNPQSGPKDFGLHDLFLADFSSGGLKMIESFTMEFTKSGADIGRHDFDVGLHINWDSQSVFMSVYVPADNHASDIIEWFSIGYKAFLADMRKNFHCWPATAEAPQIISDTVVFTKKIYVYHDNILTGEQVHNLESVYRAQGLEPTFRGSGYLEIRRLQAKVDPNTAPKELGTTKVIKGPPLPPIDMNLKD